MRKWIVVLAFALFALFFAGNLAAAPVSVETARQVALNWMNARTGGDFESSDILDHFAEKQAGATVYYRFNFHPQGWVIVSAEDAAYPVIGYSRTGACSDPSHPPAFEQWMARAGQAISRAKRARSKPPGEIAALWEQLSTNPPGYSAKTPRRKQTVGPLLQTQWHQKAPYNAFCPQDPDGNGGHAAAGCAAIAMAQVLKYHNHPTTGTGSHSYIPQTHPEYGIQYANFGETTYQWENMPNSATTFNSDLAQLIYHCAVSLDMDFGPTSSCGSLYDAVHALSSYFKYDSGLSYKRKSDYWDTEWTNMVKAELDAGRPVLYRGGLSPNGHGFVCDGYEGESHFHMNWGWGGMDNGYFYLNNLTPSDNNYTSDQEALFDVRPADQPVLSVTPSSREVSNASGTTTFEIANTGDGTLSWSLTESAHWLSVSPLSGAGDQTITVSYDAYGESGRTGTITITANGATNSPQQFRLIQGEGADELVWQTTKAEAMALARSQGKKVLLLAGRETCPNTTYMRDTICESESPAIRSVILDHYVPWYCDVDNSTEHYSYTGGLGWYTLPLICCIDPDDSNNYLDRTTSVQAADAFHTRLRSHISLIAGDIDGNDVIELRDIILALQVCADLSIVSDIHLEADVNNDGKIGMEEAIHDAAYLISH